MCHGGAFLSCDFWAAFFPGAFGRAWEFLSGHSERPFCSEQSSVFERSFWPGSGRSSYFAVQHVLERRWQPVLERAWQHLERPWQPILERSFSEQPDLEPVFEQPWHPFLERRWQPVLERLFPVQPVLEFLFSGQPVLEWLFAEQPLL